MTSKKLNENNSFLTDFNGTAIQKFYAGCSILLTGATGFFGKALIEKILRSCSEVERIYLLVRMKKGKEMNQRVAEIFEDPVFNKLKEEMPEFRHKIIGITGDCSIDGLGLNEKDRETLCKNVCICFHGAATVRFDEKIKAAVSINVQGTREIIKLCKCMPQLKALVHISTAYANCHMKEIDEKIYDSSISGSNLMKLCEWLDDRTLDTFTPLLLNKFPNTYAFTKCIAEDVVANYTKEMPVAVFRPAIVVGTAKEPICGWTDNMYGPMGVVVGVGGGLIRAMHMDRKVAANVVPVDLCVNALIACAWDIGISRYNRILVYNYVSSTRNQLSWGEYMDYYQRYGRMKPSCRAVWYYSLNDTKHRFVYLIYAFLMHIIPAAIIDCSLIVTGRRPRVLKIYKKIHKFVGVIAYFSTRQWVFNDNNVVNLWSKLSSQDRKIFYFNITDLDWQEYIRNSVDGIRLFLFKEDPSTIPAAIARMNRLMVLHFATKYVLIFFFIWIVYNISNIICFN